MKDKRRRLYEIILYEYDYDKIKYAMTLDKCKYYSILHDRDKYNKDTENHLKGDVKKFHYHLLLCFNDGITLSSLLKKLHMDSSKSNLVSFWNSNDKEGRKDYRIRYLVHYKSKDEFKFEYDIKDIVTNDDDIYKYFKDDNKQNQDLCLIFDYFDSRKDQFISYRSFLNFIYEQGLWGTFQRNSSIINRLFDEHNNDLKINLKSLFD